jgi:hypothetical protein
MTSLICTCTIEENSSDRSGWLLALHPNPPPCFPYIRGQGEELRPGNELAGEIVLIKLYCTLFMHWVRERKRRTVMFLSAQCYEFTDWLMARLIICWHEKKGFFSAHVLDV